MNKDNRSAAFLALYVDDLMKSGSKEMTEAEAEDKLDKVCLLTSSCPISYLFRSLLSSVTSMIKMCSKLIIRTSSPRDCSLEKVHCHFPFSPHTSSLHAPSRSQQRLGTNNDIEIKIRVWLSIYFKIRGNVY